MVPRAAWCGGRVRVEKRAWVVEVMTMVESALVRISAIGRVDIRPIEGRILRWISGIGIGRHRDN